MLRVKGDDLQYRVNLEAFESDFGAEKKYTIIIEATCEHVQDLVQTWNKPCLTVAVMVKGLSMLIRKRHLV